MSAKKLFVTPHLNTIDSFEDWIHETEIWQCLADLNKKKQGSAV